MERVEVDQEEHNLVLGVLERLKEYPLSDKSLYWLELVRSDLNKRYPEPIIAVPLEGNPIPQLRNKDFCPFDLTKSQMLELLMAIWEELNLSLILEVSGTQSRNFLVSVLRGYRNKPYHNATHAFAVTQFIYYMIKTTNEFKGLLNYDDFVVLIIGGLGHDLGHRNL